MREKSRSPAANPRQVTPQSTANLAEMRAGVPPSTTAPCRRPRRVAACGHSGRRVNRSCRALASTRSLRMAAPDGSSRRPTPRPTTDDGTLTRERHRLACGSPSRAPGRRPGGVTLRFSDWCPVPDGDGDLRFRAAPWWSTRFPAWRRPTGRADRPGPRSTADDGTLTRERHRLACGSPSRAPGRRPGGVTLGFSDRCLVHDGDGDLRFRAAPWWSTRSSAWRAPAWTGQLTRRGPVHFPPTATPPCPGCPVFPGAVLSDQGVGQHEKLVHGGARRVEPTDLAPVQRPTTER